MSCESCAFSFQLPVSSYEFCEVELEDVGVVDGDARIVAEFEAELFGEGRVELDAVKMRGACGEDRGDGAVAGTDLDDGASGDVAECVGDAVAGGFVGEEVLAELGFLWGHCGEKDVGRRGVRRTLGVLRLRAARFAQDDRFLGVLFDVRFIQQ